MVFHDYFMDRFGVGSLVVVCGRWSVGKIKAGRKDDIAYVTLLPMLHHYLCYTITYVTPLPMLQR